jgi:hypothetical protein
MGHIKTYPPVQYFAAITFTADFSVDRIYPALEKHLSPIEDVTESYDFSKFTDYYESEMGNRLLKKFVGFRDLGPAERLPDIKIATNKIESQHRAKSGRQVNIDPGYLCAAKIVLATTKDYDHRLYLQNGIFGDVHLRFRQGHYGANDWTYPDYQQELVLEYFMILRKNYFSKLKSWSGDPEVTHHKKDQ